MANSLKTVYCYYLSLFCGFLVFSASAQEIVIDDHRESRTYGAINLVGLSVEQLGQLEKIKEPDSFFYVRVEGSDYNMLGHYQLTDTSLIFQPRFLPDPEVTYIAFTDFNVLVHDSRQYIKSFPLRFSRSFKNRTTVISFLPDLDTLPNNVLRTYLTFSSPMGLGNPYDYIEVFDKNGHSLSEPFVVIPEGLWDEKRTRLTLLFHPGRIKRGVGPNVSKGQIFEEEKNYKLRVSKKWTDAEGRFLADNFEKSFYTSGAERHRVDISNWDIQTPDVRSTNALMIRTLRNLDPVLVERMIEIYRVEKLVSGKWESGNRGCRFIPASPWKAGVYTIDVNPKLEDISGNTLVSGFDVDLAVPSSDKVKTQLAFEIE
ncbi:MAG: hypothetical protein AAF693_04725 [Bacteroidota bacterium]